MFIFKARFIHLLTTLIAFLLLSAFIEYKRGDIAVSLIMTVMIVASVYAIIEQKGTAILNLGLGSAFFILLWLSHFFQVELLWHIGVINGIVFFMYIAMVLLKRVVNSEHVTQDTIFGAISVYLLIGISWGLIYAVIESLTPGAFSVQLQHSDVDSQIVYPGAISIFIYYSFVTMTTLGYGDIVPLTNVARTVSIFEAVLGQLFLAILIARLVGLRIQHAAQEPK